MFLLRYFPVFLAGMDIEGILREISAEIEMLQQMREIVASLETPAVPLRSRRGVRKQIKNLELQQEVNSQEISTEAAPVLVVLPPRQKREPRTRVRASSQEPKALASSIPERPVFVPRVTKEVEPKVVKAESAATAFDPAALEAALRQSLLGGVA